jgi:5-bromo-4-chloroindolyl phosphate hydrolysis protein
MNNKINILEFLSETNDRLEKIRTALHTGQTDLEEDVEDVLSDHIDGMQSEIEDALSLLGSE